MLEAVMSFSLPLLYLIGTTVSLVILTKRSFGKCLPIAMMGSAFLLFFSQLVFGTFNVGFVAGIVFGAASVGLIIRKRREWKKYKKMIFSSGFVVFLVIYVGVYIYDFARGFSAWDEFSHWGMMLKEMVRLDKFYSVDASNLLVHKDYPPIMQLFELFWIKLCGGYKEAFAERAIHTFEFSLIVPFIAEKVAEKKTILKGVLVGLSSVISVALVMVLFDQHGVFQTIYTDYVMAIIVVFMLVTILVNRKVDWFVVMTLAVSGGFLLLLKQMGLPLYLMALCFLVGMIWVRKEVPLKELIKKTGWKKILVAVLCLILPFVLWFVWGRLTADAVQQFDLSKISLGDFVRVLLGRGEDWQKLTIKKYLMALGQENISTSFIEISYLQAIVMFVGGLWGVWAIFRKHLIKKEIMWLGMILVLGAAGYAATMMVLYVLSFTSVEATELASFNRYMGTYAMIMILSLVMIVIWQATEIGKRKIMYVMVIGLMLINAPTSYNRLYPYFKTNTSGLEGYMKTAEEIRAEIGNEGEYIVPKDYPAKDMYYVQYYVTPVKLVREK